MNYLKLFEDFESPSTSHKNQSSSKIDICPYCGSTNIKISNWVKDRTARVCRKCGGVWDINFLNEN